MNIPIIHQQSDFIVVNKPAGTSFHKEDNIDGLARNLVEQTQQPLWPVHRLDKITSGLIIFAKSAESAGIFGKMFEQQQIHKCYIALSDKKPKKKMGQIIGDMKKSRSGSWKLTQTKLNPAITWFTCQSLTPGMRIFLIRPTTGKTHQIRVALKSLGAPIMGDTRYTGSSADRGYLHSYALDFDWKGQPMSFSCLPQSGEYFKSLDEQLLLALVSKQQPKSNQQPAAK